jgi:hypothetical protein
MKVFAEANGFDLSCVEGGCEWETGRNLDAHFVVSGEVSKIEGLWVCNFKALETAGGRTLGVGKVQHAEVLGLVDLLVRRHSCSPPRPASPAPCGPAICIWAMTSRTP